MTTKSVEMEDECFFIDTLPTRPETTRVSQSKPKNTSVRSHDSDLVKKMMEKATLTADFDQRPLSEVCAKSNRAVKRERKVIRESTKGKEWFDMPATEITDENRRDLELLQMRKSIDPKAQYRRNDLNVLPKYFQQGKVVDNSADYYSSRIPQRERKQTMVDELMNDYAFLSKSKQRYSEAKAREALKRKRRINPMKKFKNKKFE